MGRYGSVMRRNRTLQKLYEVLWSVTEHYGALRDVTGRYGSVTDLLTELYGTVKENINFAHH